MLPTPASSEFERFFHALEKLHKSSRAKLFAMHMAIHLVLVSMLVECFWNKVDHFKTLYDVLAKGHDNLVLLLLQFCSEHASTDASRMRVVAELQD